MGNMKRRNITRILVASMAALTFASGLTAQAPAMVYAAQASAYTQTEAFCARLYTKCLGRAEDAAGLDYWATLLTTKQSTGADVGYGFVFSDEYKNKNTSDEEFVRMLYLVFMDREADQSGLDYWMGILSQGRSREYVYKGFAESQEYTNICNSYGIERGSVNIAQARDVNGAITSFVTRIYTQALGRSYDPDGLNYWCERINNGSTTPTGAAEYFICSPEFEAKNLSNAEYIKVLYRTFMGREYDQAGLDYWVNRLNAGESRRTALASFSGCVEFKQIMWDAGIKPLDPCEANHYYYDWDYIAYKVNQRLKEANPDITIGKTFTRDDCPGMVFEAGYYTSMLSDGRSSIPNGGFPTNDSQVDDFYNYIIYRMQREGITVETCLCAGFFIDRIEVLPDGTRNIYWTVV